MKAIVAVVFLLSISSVAFGYEYAYCQFQGTSNNPGLTGYAYFQTSTTTAGAIDMWVSVSGVTNVGVNHGIHIHQFGDLSDKTSALSVGSHYSPTGTAHGCPDQGSANWHDGDTGNWMVQADGTIVGNKTLVTPKLSGVNSIIGRAVVIHNQTDDCASTGSAQARLGFCVIGIANPTYSTVNTTGNDASNGAVDGTIPVAVCDLQAINGSGVGGRIWLTPTASGVTVDALVTGLTGVHGFHVHQYGDLRLYNDTGNSAAGHYNPYSVAHGIPPYVVRHVGDMGNLYYQTNATTLAYSYNFSSVGQGPAITLTGLYNVIGRAIVVHQAPDSCAQPTGNSGARLAFCVIGIANTTATSLISSSLNVSTTQNDSLCYASPSPTASPSSAVTSASASPQTVASASSSPAVASASSSPAVASASSSPDAGNDSMASGTVPCFVVVVLSLAALIL